MQEVIVYRNPLEAAMWFYILMGIAVGIVIPVITVYVTRWTKVPYFKRQRIISNALVTGIIVGIATMFVAPWFI